MKMKVRDFIKEEIDIDVCDDYDERCYIAFAGPERLTPKGEERFSEVLDYEIDVLTNFNYPVALLHCENDDEAQKAKEFFFSAAGYCSVTESKKWFK